MQHGIAVPLKMPVGSDHTYCWCCRCNTCARADAERSAGDPRRVFLDFQYARDGWELLRRA